MPTLEIEGFGTHEVVTGRRLVLAIADAGVDIGHRCGGHAKCTTCRVVFTAGEPERMTRAEKDKLEAADLQGEVRLSCQILVDRDMGVRPLMRVATEGWSDPGPPPDEAITPPPEWTEAEG